MPFLPGQTAIVVAVAAAEPVVDRWRQCHDASAPLGVPAHVTVLYPFLSAERITETVVDELRRLVGREPAFTVTFDRCGRFPGVLYLDPAPAAPFQRLTAAVNQRWPEAPPYGGAYADVVPHLTIAHDVGEDTLTAVEREVAGWLPVLATVDEAWLLVCDGRRWTRHSRLPLGVPAA